MNPYVLTAALVAAILPASPALARETAGYTTRPTALRAGPDGNYPRIVRLPANVALSVFGCLDDRRWCDVALRTDRGWIKGSDLAIAYRGRRNALRPGLGIGTLSFAFGAYWDDHYRSRPFYGQRSRWERQDNQWGRQEARPIQEPMRAPARQRAWEPNRTQAPLDRTIPGGQMTLPGNTTMPAGPARSTPSRGPDVPLGTALPRPRANTPEAISPRPYGPGDGKDNAGGAGRHKPAN